MDTSSITGTGTVVPTNLRPGGQAAENDLWFRNGKFANLVISCEDTTFSVHEDVIFSQSRVLKAAYSSGFKESFTKTICLSDKCHLVKRMVPFFYYGSYPDLVNEPVEANVKLHIDMYSMADKYEIPGLEKVALAKFNADLTKIPHSTSGIDFLLGCIRAIYDSTPPSNRNLRELAVKHLAIRRHSIKDHDGSCELLHALNLEFADFSWDFLKDLLGIRDEWSADLGGVVGGGGVGVPKRKVKREEV